MWGIEFRGRCLPQVPLFVITRYCKYNVCTQSTRGGFNVYMYTCEHLSGNQGYLRGVEIGHARRQKPEVLRDIDVGRDHCVFRA